MKIRFSPAMRIAALAAGAAAAFSVAQHHAIAAQHHADAVSGRQL